MAWEVSDGPSSLQLCWQPEAQSDGSANEGRSMEFSVEALLAFVHCQRTPRSPGKEPRSLSRALVGVGRAGAVSFGREYRRQCTPLDWIATTWHGTPAISMESAVLPLAVGPSKVMTRGLDNVTAGEGVAVLLRTQLQRALQASVDSRW